MNHSPEELQGRLLGRRPLPPLRPSGPFEPDLAAEIDALAASPLARIGLHLFNDDLDRSHRLAQTHEGDPTADYWHALVHRREGDWDNAKYWFRRTGAHPILTALYGDDPAAPGVLVDRCREAAARPDTPEHGLLQDFQQREMAALLAHAASSPPS